MPRDPFLPDPAALPILRQRFADGWLALGLGRQGPWRLDQHAPLRAMLPPVAPGLPRLAITANVGGGLAAGDAMRAEITVDGGAWLLVPQAAERVYRAPDDQPAPARIETGLRVTGSAGLEVLPQPLLLYDGARVIRRTRLEMAAGARCLWGDILVLGRTGRGESWRSGLLDDQLRVERDGRILILDCLRLDPEASPSPHERPTALAGCTALATILAQIEDPDRHRDRLREALAPGDDPVAVALTSHRGLLIARLMAPRLQDLQRHFLRLWQALRRDGLGRVAPLPGFIDGSALT